jgi:hypothetical protein
MEFVVAVVDQAGIYADLHCLAGSLATPADLDRISAMLAKPAFWKHFQAVSGLFVSNGWATELKFRFVPNQDYWR